MPIKLISKLWKFLKTVNLIQKEVFLDILLFDYSKGCHNLKICRVI
jgi:hypothetical protein